MSTLYREKTGRPMRYYVIGTDHKLQQSNSQDTGLKDVLECAIGEYVPVVLIAEEVDANRNVSTFGRELIGADKWLSIDMTTNERKTAGIYEELRSPPDKKLGPNGYYRVNPYLKRAEGIRENFWLDRIEVECRKRQLYAGTIILTCGFNHVGFLSEKIIARHSENIVVQGQYLPYDPEKVHGVFTIYP